MILEDAMARDVLREQLAPYLNWDPISRHSKIQHLVQIYRTIDESRVPGAIIPLVRGGRMAFVVVADDAAAWRRLVPLTVAAVGVTITDFRGSAIMTDDPVDNIMRERLLQFSHFGTPEGDRRRAELSVKSLCRLIHALKTIPVTPRDLPRSQPQLLHELDLALVSGDRDLSWLLLRELEERRIVDTLNLRFLAVRWHAAFQEWQRLRDKQWFNDLCRTRRPLRVTVELLRTIYETDLGGRALLTDPPALLQRFRSRVAGETGDLLQRLLPDPNAVTAIMLALDSTVRSHGERIVRLRGTSTATWESQEREAFDAILTLGAPPVSSYVPEAEPMLVEILRKRAEGPPLTDAERTAVRFLIGSGESLSLVEQGTKLVGITLGELATNEMSTHTLSTELPEDWVTGSWDGWFEALPRLNVRRARELSQSLAEEVDVEGTLATDSDCDQFARNLEQALSSEEDKAVQGLPHIVAWIQSHKDWPTERLAPLYRALIVDFLLFDSRTVERFRLTLSLLDGWLATGPQTSDYAAVLRDFRDSLDSFVSDRMLDPLIDLAEILVVHTPQDLKARASLWAALHSRLSAYGMRMTRSQISIFNGICEAMGTARTLALADRGAPDAYEATANCRSTIGIYTLRPTVGQRVADVLSERMPGAKVTWRSDHVATASLRQLATRAEVMAVDWSASKHAATAAVTAALGERSPLWVRGGASSMVSQIVDEIERRSRSKRVSGPQ